MSFYGVENAYTRVMREHAELFNAASPEVQAEATAYSDFMMRDRSWRPPSPSMFTNLLSDEELAGYRTLVRGKSDYSEAAYKAMQLGSFDGSVGPLEFDGTMENGLELTEDDFEREPYMQDGIGIDYMYDPYAARRPDSPLVGSSSRDSPIRSRESSSRSTEDTAWSAGSSSTKSSTAKKNTIGRKATSARGRTSRASLAQTSRAGLRNSRTSLPSSSVSTDGPSSSSHSSSLAQLIAIVPDQSTCAKPTPSTHTSGPPSFEFNPQLGPATTPPPPPSDGPSSSSRLSTRTRRVSSKRDYSEIIASVTPQPGPQPLQTSVGAKQYRCLWRERFGGECTHSFDAIQGHDRHIVTHLPDDDGYEICNYKCTICGDEFPRDDSCIRHVQKRHSKVNASPYCEKLERQWWWPLELFHSPKYNNPQHVLPAPKGNTRTWKERLDVIIQKHPGVVNKPARPKSKDGSKGDGAGRKTGQTAKRQKTV